MCGIAGLLYRDGRRVDPRLLARMTGTLRHRGPDGGDLWTDGPVGLGHRRLAIRDLSDAGRQPFQDQSGRVVVSYNGEIYNYAELRAELERDFSAVFRTSCDTEIIPYGYLAWGEGVFARLEGMFAIALWDKARQTLFLARDGVGIKPLYYSEGNDVVRFGSEIKALLADAEQTRQISCEGLHRFLAMGYVGPTTTTLEGIRQVAPGTVISFTERDTTQFSFWKPTRAPIIRNLDDAIQAFRPIWSRVMQDHLASDVPIGVLQSGGVDSTLVAVEARRSRQTPLFNARFTQASFDESAAAAHVSEWLDCALHSITIDSNQSIADALIRVVHQYDGQNCDEASVPLYLLCAEVRKHVTVGLTGDGGDEAFGGYPTYRASRLAAAIGPFIPNGILELIGRLAYYAGGSNEARLPVIAAVSRLALGMSDGSSHAHTQWRRLLPKFQMSPLYGPLMRDFVDQDPLVEYKEALDQSAGTLLDRCLLADQRFHLPAGLLMKSDAMSMAHSLELRVPFLDRRIIDFAGSCHGSLLTDLAGGTKTVLRGAARELGTPTSIARAPKRGFNAPLAQLLRTGLREMANDYFENAPDVIAPYLDPETVRLLWRQHRDREANHAYALWPILNFAIWKQNLAKSAPDQEFAVTGAGDDRNTCNLSS